MSKTDDQIAAVTNDADDLAAELRSAFAATTSHARTHPVIMGDDLRDVLIDGHFDFVVIARHVREALRRELTALATASQESKP